MQNNGKGDAVLNGHTVKVESTTQISKAAHRLLKGSARAAFGYTLIELVIVVAIIGLLSAVAYPSYTKYVIRAHRVDAMEVLNEIMAQQQRYVLRKRTFTTNLDLLGYDYAAGYIESDDGFYRITPQVCGVGIPITRCVQLTAVPTAGTIQEGDGNLTLNSRGRKTWGTEEGWNHSEVP